MRRWSCTSVLLALISIALCCAMLILGNTIYPIEEILQVLSGSDIDGVTFAVLSLRLPRMAAGLFAGFAFGIAGQIFQTMLRNPLANPNVIGITSGSSAAAVFCILILHTSRQAVSAASVAGGLLTVLAIWLLSGGKVFSGGRLILIGIGVQVMLNAVVSYLILVGAQQDIPTAFRWLNGSLNGVQMSELWPLILCVIICTPVLLFFGRHLSLLELGEEAASTLGIHTGKTRILLSVGAVLLSAAATAATGPISFVAFLSGPIAKKLAGSGTSAILPSGLVGSVLVLGGDLIGQFAFHTRFPVGVITGIIGAPYLLFLLIRMNRMGDL